MRRPVRSLHGEVGGDQGAEHVVVGAGPGLQGVDVLHRLGAGVHPTAAGSVWRAILPLHGQSAGEDQHGGDGERAWPPPSGREPSQAVSRPSRPVEKSRPLVGDPYSRMPEDGQRPDDAADAHGDDADDEGASRTGGSSAPWRTAGRRRRNTASKVTTSSAGPRFRAVAWIGCGASVQDHLLLHPRGASGWRSRSPPRAAPAGRPRWPASAGCRPSRPGRAPHQADGDDEEGQQPPPDVEEQQQDDDHHHGGGGAQGAACPSSGSR